MKILAIETSCDETGVCLMDASGTFGTDFRYTILGDALLSQVAVHAPFGGVYPNLAKREHEHNLVPVLTECLTKASALAPGNGGTFDTTLLDREPTLAGLLSTFLSIYARPQIDAIAVTTGPGLEPALWVGINFAKALAQAWNLPLVAVNHMEGHVLIAAATEDSVVPIEFPALSLLVSGGHTELVLSREWGDYTVVGSTRDDAAGEAFDKSARLLGLPYPGGPEISKLASLARAENILSEITLPRPMLHEKSFDFSFSGLKTAVRREVERLQPLSDTQKKMFAREVEDAIVEVLVAKTAHAAEEYAAQTIIVGGGVSANGYLKSAIHTRLDSLGLVLFPTPDLATDNARMIAFAGYYHAERGEFADPSLVRAQGGLKIGASTT